MNILCLASPPQKISWIKPALKQYVTDAVCLNICYRKQIKLGKLSGRTARGEPFVNTMLPETRIPLLGLSLYELEMQMEQLQLPRFRARQLWRWVWRHGLTDFSDMTDLGKSVKLLLAQHFHADRPLVSRRQNSADGTIKWLIKLVDGQEAETVYIPESDRGTLCISSQVGCTLTCSFCHTGTQRLVRNLSVDEICGQVLLAMDELCLLYTSPSPRD